MANPNPPADPVAQFRQSWLIFRGLCLKLGEPGALKVTEEANVSGAADAVRARFAAIASVPGCPSALGSDLERLLRPEGFLFLSDHRRREILALVSECDRAIDGWVLALSRHRDLGRKISRKNRLHRVRFFVIVPLVFSGLAAICFWAFVRFYLGR